MNHFWSQPGAVPDFFASGGTGLAKLWNSGAHIKKKTTLKLKIQDGCLNQLQIALISCFKMYWDEILEASHYFKLTAPANFRKHKKFNIFNKTEM